FFVSVRLRVCACVRFRSFRGRPLPSADGFFPSFLPFFLSFSPCYPLFPYRSPGRLSEMRQETFFPKRRIILYRKLRIRSERAKQLEKRNLIGDMFTSP
ncbi:hypothetical protein, partial [Phocaeicola plebeius]|uniref:hypothetical protein n=1 Tax=Phocaeicola plebeius TaxID=310297 RepID=UPI003AB7F989